MIAERKKDASRLLIVFHWPPSQKLIKKDNPVKPLQSKSTRHICIEFSGGIS